jgi:UDP-2,3-diacylglucosamine pyrophosphatase LpxH
MKEKIDTLILSDIHLGSKFCRADKVLEILGKYDFKRLILNGDIFDGLNFKRLNRHHWEILSKIRKLSSVCEVVWINGNHDGDAALLSRLIGVRVYKNYSWEIKGKKALAIHGHQFDRFLHKNAVLSGIMIFIYYTIARFDGEINLFANWLKKRSGSWLRLSREVARGAIRYARMRSGKYIFCGHTHNPMKTESGKIQYYNSGSWVEKPSNYIVIKGSEIKIEKVG